MGQLSRDEVKKFFFRFNDEDKERYADRFIDWFDRTNMLDERRTLIVNHLPLFLAVYELGLYANSKSIMQIRRLAMGVPA